MRRALSFIVRNGPASDQDRWEESAGLNTFTLAACIAALVSGAQYLRRRCDASCALDVADYWNSRLEDWTAVHDTPLARQFGIPGYYVRVAPSQAISDRGALNRVVSIKNQAMDPGLPAAAQFGVDFLQLVRFGLRRCDDPLILGSVRLADALLKVDTPYGPCWRRYHDDGYGEHDDGSAYDGTGRGRAWPLLTGERGHYEIACGKDPLPLMEAMARMASPGGMLPEQVWDATAHSATRPQPRPANRLGHAARLDSRRIHQARCISCDGSRPSLGPRRYGSAIEANAAKRARAMWCEHAPIREITAGASLVIALRAPALVRFGFNGWQDIAESRPRPTASGCTCCASIPRA